MFTKRIKERIRFFVKARVLRINPKKLHAEIANELPVSANQIQYWQRLYESKCNPLNHPYVEIAQLYTNACMHERASTFYERFLAKDANRIIHSLYLQNLLLSESANNQSLLTAHQHWHDTHIKINKQMEHQRKPKQPGEKIRIGYVCHFFTNSVSQNVLLPLLKLHDRTKFEIYCYNDGEKSDQPQSYCDHWRDIHGQSDEEVARLIKHDNIDILQELNGFCIINRFGALGYRPAPIQINWYNHTSTTGLPFIDYVMSDEISIPDTDLPYLVENAYRHKEFIAAVYFDKNKFTDTPKQAPCASGKPVMFCYFGGSHKITLKAIELWSKILHRVHDAKLMLKCGSFTHHLYRILFLQHFAKFDITSDRLIFEGWSDQTSTLKKYHEIDIMLDNVPINGGSTMFEALMQGIPVVSMMGQRWGARSGPSVLTTLKHPELIAHSPEEYVNIAVQLAHDIPRLNHYRRSLQNEMLQSPLTNMQQFYQKFEDAYLYMWNRWCNG